MPLSKLTSEHIQRELNRISAAGKGKTADLLRAVLRSAFNKAVKLRRLSINVALSLGLRKGEVLGLKPDDIDLANGVVHVRRSLEWVKMPDEDTGH